VTAAGLAVLGSTPAGVAQAAGIDSLFAGFDQLAKQTLSDNGVPGMSVGLVYQGKTVYAKGFGVTRVGTNLPVSVRSVQPICSMSKAFASVALMQLVEAGKIDIETPLVQYVPYFKLQDSSHTQITIRHLLTHTSGLPENTDLTFWNEWLFPQYDDRAVERYVRSLSKRPFVLTGPLGQVENFHYSDLGYDILAAVIQEVSGEFFAQYCRKHILEPLGMVSSSFLKTGITPGLLEAAHVRDEFWNVAVSPIYPYNRIHGPSSGLFTNIADMSRWALMHLNGGVLNGRRILSQASHDKLWTPLLDFGSGWGYGWGWLFRPDAYKGQHLLVAHGGAQPGICTNITLVPDLSVAMIALGNYQNGTDDYASNYTGPCITQIIKAIDG